MDYVARGYEWALDDYYEALDIRNDDLRWVLSDAQYRRFLGAGYFYRPIYVTGGKWSFRVYVNYPDVSVHYADEWKYSDGTGQNRNPNDDKSGILADLSPDAVQNNG